jgi:hypothetical protein
MVNPEPELQAAYERIDELTNALKTAQTVLVDVDPETADLIEDTLDELRIAA